MKKEINEKTFELNITTELLNISKSFLWYLDHCTIRNYFTFEDWSKFLNNSILFAEGLTQEQESNPEIGGYDVSISYRSPNGDNGRLLFLQYKAGVRTSFSKTPGSIFEKVKEKSTEHVCFKFNDAANNTQHSTLRKLANSLGKSSDSVLYVFPRITEKSEFYNKVGSLIYNTSFVPVLEIDKQGATKNPPIIISNDPHKFRVSYDGKITEVNLLLLLMELDQSLLPSLLAELICIQIERLLKYFKRQNRSDLIPLLDEINISILRFLNEKIQYSVGIIVEEYVQNIRINLFRNMIIPSAPSRFTTIIPKEGLRVNFEEKLDLTLIKYLIF